MKVDLMYVIQKTVHGKLLQISWFFKYNKLQVWAVYGFGYN